MLNEGSDGIASLLCNLCDINATTFECVSSL